MRDRLDYFHGLRTVKTALKAAENDGLIVETTPPWLCSPEHPHHVHKWQIREPLVITIVNSADERVVSTDIREVWLGHPCGILATAKGDTLNISGRTETVEFVKEIKIEKT